MVMMVVLTLTSTMIDDSGKNSRIDFLLKPIASIFG